MTTNTAAHPAGVEVGVLAQVVRLLCRCTDLAFEKVQDHPMSDLAGLGLGAALLADQTMSLLPSDADADAIDAVVDEPVVGYDDPHQVLRAAEALTRTLPIEAFPPGASLLVVGMCDLIRELPS